MIQYSYSSSSLIDLSTSLHHWNMDRGLILNIKHLPYRAAGYLLQKDNYSPTRKYIF